MNVDTDSLPFVLVGVGIALPFVLVGYQTWLGASAGWALVWGPLLSGTVVGYARGSGHRAGVATGLLTGVAVAVLFALHFVQVYGLDIGLLATGLDYWLTGEPTVTVTGGSAAVSTDALSLSRFYYPLWVWSLLVTPVGGLLGGQLRSWRRGQPLR